MNPDEKKFVQHAVSAKIFTSLGTYLVVGKPQPSTVDVRLGSLWYGVNMVDSKTDFPSLINYYPNLYYFWINAPCIIEILPTVKNILVEE